MEKRFWINFLVILGVLIIAAIILIQPSKSNPNNNENSSELELLSKCLGEKTTLYVQLGCHACEIQEEMFGNYVDNLNIVDCWEEREKCGEITATPSWLINGEVYKGVQSIENLKILADC